MTHESDPKKSSSSQEVDALLNEAKALKSRFEKSVPSEINQNKKLSDTGGIHETLQSVSENLSYLRRVLVHAKEMYLGVHERFFRPVWDFIKPPLKFISRIYRRIWNRWAYVTNSQTGERILSRRKSSLLIGCTFLFVAAFTPTSIGDAVRFVTIEPVMDGFLILASKKSETFFLNNSEEIDHFRNIHAVRGCRIEGMCSEKDAVYFRVKPRLAHDVWKFIEYGNPIYVPDHVVAPIAPGVNKCKVTYYGYRMTSSWISRLIRSFQIYPTMLEASCVFLGNHTSAQSSDGALKP